MLRVELRGLASRKLRTALTALAVVLGVALIAGTYILTDTINASFDNIFSTASKGVDVSVTPKEAVKQQNAQAPAFSATLLDRVRAVPGVKQAAGGIFSQATIYDKHGKNLSAAGAPGFVTAGEPKPFDPFRYVKGKPPTTSGEVALDRSTADKAGYHVGDRVEVAGNGPRRTYRLSGIARFGDVGSVAGASVAILTLPEAQSVLDLPGRLDNIDVQAAPGVPPRTLVARLKAALPSIVTVRTGQQQAKSQATDIRKSFSFLRTILLVFGGVVLFVGAFMIFNTFSITIAQRAREFALLRTLGASRRQVLRSVVAEAGLVGLASAVVGLLAGIGLAPGLRALFTLFGADLPSSGTVLETRTIVVSLVVGVVVTVVASLAPALRATRVPPIAALREGAVLPPGRLARVRVPLAIVLALAGVALLVGGLFGGVSGGRAAGLAGGGAAIVFVGVALMSSVFVRPLAVAVGAPLARTRGVVGALARENAERNPGRTAATAAALMIGLALVTFVTIFAAGLKSSIRDNVEKGFRGAFVLQNTDQQGQPIPAASARALKAVPGIGTVAEVRMSASKVRGVGEQAQVSGVDGAQLASVYRLDWTRGSPAALRSLGPADVLVSKQFADSHGVKVGRTLSLTTPADRHVQLTVRGIYKDDAQLLSDLTVATPTMLAAFGAPQPAVVLAGRAPGASEAAVQRAAKQAMKPFPTVDVLTKKEFTDDVAKQVNQILTFFYVLLSLAVIVSLFGIVNTLALSIHERTRELGMMRAIGTSRRQVRQIIRYESVITALIGAVLGMVLGVFFAVVVTIPLTDQGFTLSFPVGTLIVLLVLAALAGVLAAIGPARRAASIDVLEALAYE
jgi:putative ABC transport system permease protein